MTENNTEKKNRAVLVGLSSRVLAPEENADEASMEELSALLETAGGECVGVVTQSKDSPDPRTFIGEGKVAEVKEVAHAMDADMVIFDNGLSPSQQRVLSEDLGVSVLDRSALILDIFAQRARTREGRLQVELAQYQYLLPRLIGMWHPRPRRDPVGGRPAAHPPQDLQAGGGAEGCAPGAGHPAGAAHQERGTGGGHCGLYQCGQIHPAQPAHRGGHPGQ